MQASVLALIRFRICIREAPQEFWAELIASQTFKPIDVVSKSTDLDYGTLSQMDAASKKEKLAKNRAQLIGINLQFFETRWCILKIN